MSLSPEIRRLAQQALVIRNSQVPLHRVLDVLATADGDVSQAINRFRDIRDPELRRAFHYCAELLRQIERAAGLTPAWENAQQQKTLVSTPSPGENAASSSTSSPAEKPPRKTKFSAEELRRFEDDNMRGKVRAAKVYVDGASKGNPGASGIGVAMFTMDGQKIAQESRAIGTATNNIAEYSALIESLQMAQRMGVKVLHVISDSELMVKQMTGKYKIKNPEILKKVQEAMALTRQLEKFNINYVGREHNTLADALSTFHLKKEKGTATASAKSDGATNAAQEPYRDAMGKVEEYVDDGSTE